MAEFTSTGLVQLMLKVLGEADPALVDGIGRPGPMATAVEPDATKRLLVARAMERHGPGLLLSVGQHLADMDETPVRAILVASRDPSVLADKWMRLERYFHSSHRTRIVARPTGWFCRREALREPALPGENCLIAGLLYGLLGEIGMKGARLLIAGRELVPEDFPGFALPPREDAEAFAIGWERAAVRRSRESPHPETGNGGDLAARLVDLVAADAGRVWRIEAAAAAVGLSARTLQRRLTAAGWTFQAVVRRARMRAATALLAGSPASLAEIGYCCGYADQAHFQRDFRRMTNMTPKTYRELATSGE